LMAGVATYSAGLAGKRGTFLLDSRDSVGQGRAGSSWNVPAEFSIEHLLYWDKRQNSLRHKSTLSLSDKGLVVTGCRWHVDKVIDLSEVRALFLQKEKQINISDLLEDGPLGSRAPLESARAGLLLCFLCHPQKSGYKSLVKRIWQELRLQKSSDDHVRPEVLLLRAREGPPAKEIKTWSNASFEEIVDVDLQL
jgi:hypothetical protein